MQKTLLTSLILGCALSLSSPQAATVLDSTAAVVNDDIILTSELDEMTNRVLARQPALDELTARRTAMEQLITRSILLQYARNVAGDMTDMQIDQLLEQVARSNNQSSRAILDSFGSHLTEAQKRQAFMEEAMINQYRTGQLRSRVAIAESEINSMIQTLKNAGTIEPRYHLLQMIVPLASDPSREQYTRAQNTARTAIAQARAGEDFLTLASRYSVGIASTQIGDLGFVPETSVPLPFVPSLVKAQPGAVIGPIRSPLGFHIIKLLEVSHEAITPIRTYDANHILIKTSIVFSDEAARAKLEDLRAQIISGSITFAAAAKQYSEDPGSAINGGALGYAEPGRYDPDFARAMVALKPGQISEPIKSSFGWHIILLNDVKVDENSDAAYRDRARSIIIERKMREEAGIWERQLRESAYIHINDPQLVAAGVTN